MSPSSAGGTARERATGTAPAQPNPRQGTKPAMYTPSGVRVQSDLAPRGVDISEALRRAKTVSFYIITFLIITAGAIWLALRVTPLQTVSAAGQTAQVGATLP